MKIVFMGTPDFAVPTLEALIEKHQVVAVFTQPDRPKGRGKKLSSPPVKSLALENDIPVFQPDRIKTTEWVETLKALKPDAIVVVAYGQILSKEILEMPLYGCVNVHGSLLPKYRGAAPIQWAVANGDLETGVTTMLMDQGLDTGAILLSAKVPIEQHTTAGMLYESLAQVGASLLINTLSGLQEGSITPIKQDDSQATHAVILNKKISKIDWHMSAEEIESRIRGFNPWPVAHTLYMGETLKVFKAEVVKVSSYKGLPGEIVEGTNEILVMTGQGLLKILELQLGSQKRMQTSAFLLGKQVEVGTVLGASKED